MLEIELPARLQKRLSGGHPWVYRDQISGRVRARTGDWVRVRAGRFQAVGLWDADSAIGVRIFWRSGEPAAARIEARVRQALAARATLRSAETTAYRLLFGEGDGIPGVVVDVYGSVAVMMTYAACCETVVPWVADAIEGLGIVDCLVRRSADKNLSALFGRLDAPRFEVVECGVRFHVDLASGQKSGLFLDHRENRAALEPLCDGRSVLNLYAYTGAFSLYAARGGARSVVSVDSAKPACVAAEQNFELNGFETAHEVVAEDVTRYVERAQSRGEQFDVVICDPPSFAKHKGHVERAVNAYLKLNTAALRLVRDGGVYAAASCTSQVAPEVFRDVIARSAYHAKRDFAVIREAGHAVDHPVRLGHPEGRYLKFILGHVSRWE